MLHTRCILPAVAAALTVATSTAFAQDAATLERAELLRHAQSLKGSR